MTTISLIMIKIYVMEV